jgi:hypothetical protein
LQVSDNIRINDHLTQTSDLAFSGRKSLHPIDHGSLLISMDRAIPSAIWATDQSGQPGLRLSEDTGRTVTARISMRGSPKQWPVNDVMICA